MSQSCINCGEARQAGDKSRQDVVGCRLLNLHEKHQNKVVDVIYEGWYYGGRRPHDVAESKEIGRGVISRGILIDATGYCNSFSERR